MQGYLHVTLPGANVCVQDEEIAQRDVQAVWQKLPRRVGRSSLGLHLLLGGALGGALGGVLCNKG
jgi:hypothetical protein